MTERHYTASQIDAKLNVMRDELLDKIDRTVVTTLSDDDYAKTSGKSLILDVVKVERKFKRED